MANVQRKPLAVRVKDAEQRVEKYDSKVKKLEEVIKAHQETIQEAEKAMRAAEADLAKAKVDQAAAEAARAELLRSLVKTESDESQQGEEVSYPTQVLAKTVDRAEKAIAVCKGQVKQQAEQTLADYKRAVEQMDAQHRSLVQALDALENATRDEAKAKGAVPAPSGTAPPHDAEMDEVISALINKHAAQDIQDRWTKRQRSS